MTRMNSFFRVAAILALGLFCTSASAGIITVNFELEIVSPGDYLGDLITGSISYEDAGLTGAGFESLIPPDVEIDALALGQAFDEGTDIDFPDFPAIEFFDGALVNLDFLILESSGVDIDAIGVDGISMQTDLLFDAGSAMYTGTAEVFTRTVPEPTSLAVWSLIGLVGGWRRKRKAA